MTRDIYGNMCAVSQQKHLEFRYCVSLVLYLKCLKMAEQTLMMRETVMRVITYSLISVQSTVVHIIVLIVKKIKLLTHSNNNWWKFCDNPLA